MVLWVRCGYLKDDGMNLFCLWLLIAVATNSHISLNFKRFESFSHKFLESYMLYQGAI